MLSFFNDVSKIHDNFQKQSNLYNRHRTFLNSYFNQTENTSFSNSSIINIPTRRRRRRRKREGGGGGGIFVSHLENICLFPSTDPHLHLFQHSFVPQTLTNDKNDGGAVVRIIEETHEGINLTRTGGGEKKKRNKDSEKVGREEINRCTNSIWRARLVVVVVVVISS